MNEVNTLSKQLLDEAKRQFYSGQISHDEYYETLYLIFERLTEIENYPIRKEYLLNTFRNKGFQFNVKDVLNYSIGLN